MAEPTVLIVGAGTFGTSIAYHLAQTYKDPRRVTVIDRRGGRAPTTGPDDAAAAIDINRIIRTDYVSPLYCNLANEAIHPWFWSQKLGHHFHKTGWVLLDESGGAFARGVRETFRRRGSDYTKDVDVRALKKQFEVLEGMKTDGLGTAYFNPEAGWCDAASATASFMAAAEKKGVRRATGEISELLLDPGRGGRRGAVGVVAGVRTKDGRQITADQIVLASGAWTSSLLSPVEDALRVAERDRIERQIRAVGRVSAYYTLSPRETAAMCEAGLPVVVYAGQGILTPPSRENRTLKINDMRTEVVNTVTTATGREVSAPPAWRDQADVPERLRRETEGLLEAMVPGLARARKPDRWRVCWDAKTPTEDWLLCRHPDARLDNLYLAVGGNFSSYKFMPIIGGYMCNVLKGKSNGDEKDAAWSWKTDETLGNTEVKELGCQPRSAPLPEYTLYEDIGTSSKL